MSYGVSKELENETYLIEKTDNHYYAAIYIDGEWSELFNGECDINFDLDIEFYTALEYLTGVK